MWMLLSLKLSPKQTNLLPLSRMSKLASPNSNATLLIRQGGILLLNAAFKIKLKAQSNMCTVLFYL